MLLSLTTKAPLLALVAIVVSSLSAVAAVESLNPTNSCSQYYPDDTAYWYTGTNLQKTTSGRATWTWTTNFASHSYTLDLIRRDDGSTSLGMISRNGGDRQFKIKIYYNDDNGKPQMIPFWLSKVNSYCLTKFLTPTAVPFDKITNVEARERCTRGVYACQMSKHTPIEHP
jgi:hypothetical protein